MTTPDRIHITTDLGMVGTGRWVSAGLENPFGLTVYLHRDGETLRRVEEALWLADQYIRNGIELGYIRMPDASTPDPAHETPVIVSDALAKLREG